MQNLLDTAIWNGRTLGDLLTLEFLISIFGNLVAAILILIAGFILASWIKNRIQGLAEKHARLDQTLFDFLGNVARYVVIGFAFLFVLNTFGVQTTSLIAVIGAAGLAIGLALQGTLSNVAAGIMIIFFRPFKLGDFVDLNGKLGTVKSINLNFTELASIGNVQIIVPNAEIWGNTMQNYSAYPLRRAEWTFGVGYGANLAEAERVIRETIMADERSLAEPEPFLQVNELNASSVDFLCRVWVPSADFFQYQADMKRKVKEALDANGVPIPFPTRTLHIARDEDDDEEGGTDMAAPGFESAPQPRPAGRDAAGDVAG
ncbi:mechanosensitive ion channel family protein [Wenxinia marina]|uniref:Small-conductance mechanosensitive channel n=1 Tax=Wenxinia marina DSM 24838 TaxID=1123501 RepID=A0A0D0PHJ4_9RHOB|nr:mechanosensitive ion channel domain-containing protein [Wenxinia marina]KIQ70846.1 Small-conductance mechanosensitive channel [Wenxinia marina DSM 24838]GGL56864.1 mechanosensitive ion channel protein MscS [Wenxinia marina]